MTTTSIPGVSCAVFRNLPPHVLEPDAIHRFVVGEDDGPRKLSTAEARAELGDPFATLLLLQGIFPRTAGEVLSALSTAALPGDPLGKAMFFFVGEGSQIPFTPETRSLQRNLRFLVSTGAVEPDGPDILLSSFHPDRGDVELMAWDRVTGGFNYYQTVGDTSAWVFAGNSRHALLEPTEFKGPFESHTSGNFLMKELRAPWLHWHSPDAPVPPNVFDEDDPLANHPWFRDRERLGAFTCETVVARSSIVRWTKTRFAALLEAGGSIGRPARIMQQVLDTPTVNLITSHTESNSAVRFEQNVDLPQTFFVDSQGLTETLGLQAPPPFSVAASIYAQSLDTFEFHLSDGGDFQRAGDTHFAFAVPERAFEDEAVLGEAIKVGLITPRLAACLLMTDFPNPIFSPRRAALLKHVPSTARITDGQSGFSQAVAEAILAASERSEPGSPEREFGERWAVGEAWKDEFNRLLSDYYDAVTQRLQSQEGFNAYCRLAQSRRDRVREMPIFESPLLFAQTNIPPGERAMRADGTVAGG